MPTRSTRRSTALDRSSKQSNENKADQVSDEPDILPPQSSKVSQRKASNGVKSKKIKGESEPGTLPHGHSGSNGTIENTKASANVGKKRKRSAPLKDEDSERLSDSEELPHNMGSLSTVKREPEIKGSEEKETESSAKKRAKGNRKAKEEHQEPQKDEQGVKTGTGDSAPVSSRTTPKKSSAMTDNSTTKPNKDTKSPTKKDTYGLSEGTSPFPNYPRPTPEECHKVARLLQKAHPNCRPRPKTLPEPSQIVAGCGDVPSILDAMVRTLLSAATNGRNSSNAYQGMIKRYGNAQTGVGKGSVDYNAVRLASQADLEKAIAKGGLAKNKSKNIKAILDMVHAENEQRSKDVLDSISHLDRQSGPDGFMRQDDGQQAAEVEVAEKDFLSLDHLHYLPTYAAIAHLTKYPGIGVKTAACVALFCMQRDVFAVDTHVFRLCKWLGWVPDQSAPGYVKAKGEPRVDRDPTFSHLEVRISDELKYNLHQLFIQHGKKCGRCRGNTSESHPEWKKGCVIEGLVDRSGPRKGGNSGGKAKKTTAKNTKKRKQISDDEELDDDEEVEMSDLVEDEDEDEVEEAMPDIDDEEEFDVPSTRKWRKRHQEWHKENDK